MSRQFRVLLLGACCAIGLSAQAQQALSSRVSEVALFKQGYGCIVREVMVPAHEAETVIADMPVPVHGTFWLLPAPEVTILSATAAEGERTREVPAVTLPELLRASVGEFVNVKTADGWTGGKLLAVADNRTDKPEVSTAAAAYDGGYYRGYYPNSGNASAEVTRGDYLILDTQEGQTALYLSAVTQVRKDTRAGAGTPLFKMHFSRTVPGAVLHVRTQGAGGILRIAYLTPGLTWAPSYHIDISGKTAHVLGKAVVMNDVEDLQTQSLACLAGFPNMKFAHVTDPLALKESVTQFLSSLQRSGEENRNGRQNAVMTQQVTMNAAYTPPGADLSTAPSELSNEDIHEFRFKDIAVKQGERVYLPLCDLQAPFSEVYRWDVRDLHENTYRWYMPQENEQTQPEEIWHAIRLKNIGKQPWTTSPVMITNGDRFLGQDILYYTSAGSGTLVNITKAMDVKAKFTEQTAENKGTQEIGTHVYHVYVVAGRLLVNNWKGEQIHLLINKKLTGELIDSSLKPADVTEAPRHDLANATSTVVWDTEILAGKSAEITFKYKIVIMER